MYQKLKVALKGYGSLVFNIGAFALTMAMSIFTYSVVGWNWPLVVGPALCGVGILLSVLGIWAKRKLQQSEQVTE